MSEHRRRGASWLLAALVGLYLGALPLLVYRFAHGPI